MEQVKTNNTINTPNTKNKQIAILMRTQINRLGGNHLKGDTSSDLPPNDLQINTPNNKMHYFKKNT